MEIEGVTADADVKRVLSLLTEGLVDLLGAQFVGLYVFGSLTYGEFDEGREHTLSVSRR